MWFVREILPPANMLAALLLQDVRTVLNFIILVSELSSDYGTIPSDSIRSHVSRVAFGAINRSLTFRASQTKRPSGEERRQAATDSNGSDAGSTGRPIGMGWRMAGDKISQGM